MLAIFKAPNDLRYAPVKSRAMHFWPCFCANAIVCQVRGISTVTQAIANGDMSRKIDVEAKGEILILKETINNMVDRLSIFCNEVQRVAKDVGVDGIMGGQADVAGLKGRWKEITTDVNTMANNLVSTLSPLLFFLELSTDRIQLVDCSSTSVRRYHERSNRR